MVSRELTLSGIYMGQNVGNEVIVYTFSEELLHNLLSIVTPLCNSRQMQIIKQMSNALLVKISAYMVHHENCS